MSAASGRGNVGGAGGDLAQASRQSTRPVHIAESMQDVKAEKRSTAAALVADLEGLLAALAQTEAEADVGWLRPLALLSAEIEYSALRRTDIDAGSLAEECRELSDLLACSPRASVRFVARYPVARGRSPSIAALHERAIAACDALGRFNA